ncbi:cytidine deaminase [uncultured Traorella sp.]|uniref:cytidine deaminase n=1 Tax=uncultured Traorella sp. TaxID=1929048 RepID=UPI0025EDF3BE|nr:cytidine deaminase [uncultured Traorella sp.]
MIDQKLVERAFKNLENAYAPYSRYRVGACLETVNGDFYDGANIENASFGLTNCAERSAVFAAYSKGVRKEDIKALAIVCEGNTIAAPCGACRQVLVELLKKDTPIYLANRTSQLETTIEQLLPMSFTQEDL